MILTLINLLKVAWTIIKLVAVAIFFYRFLRKSTLIAAIGLITIASAVLLDAASNVLGMGNLVNTLGFLSPVIQGLLFAGAAIWLLGTLRPKVLAQMGGTPSASNPVNAPLPSIIATSNHATAARIRSSGGLETAYDRQMLYDQVRTRFGREDIFDLIFDMGLNENDLVGLNRDINSILVRLMDTVEAEHMTGQLSLAVERILTPPDPDTLPRLERLNEETPPTLLRHYLLSQYTLKELEQLAGDLEIDWEQLGVGSKKEKVRQLLLYLYRRNRIYDLIALMQQENQQTEDE
jgi:hypothetical protein